MKGKLTTTLIFFGMITYLGGQLYLINQQKKEYQFFLKKQKRSLIDGLILKWRHYLVNYIQKSNHSPEYSLTWDRSGTILTKKFFPSSKVSLPWSEYREYKRSHNQSAMEKFLVDALTFKGSWDRVLAINEMNAINPAFDFEDISPFEKTILHQEAFDAYKQIFSYVRKLNYLPFAESRWQFNKLFYRINADGDLQTAIPSIKTLSEKVLPGWLHKYDLELVSIGPLPWDIQVQDTLNRHVNNTTKNLNLAIHTITILVFLLAFYLFQSSLKDKKKELLTKVTFLNQIVHEIKTPLTALKIHSRIISDILEGETFSKLQDKWLNKKQLDKSLSAFGRNVNRINQLFDDIIYVNRPFKKSDDSISTIDEQRKIVSELSSLYAENFSVNGEIKKKISMDGSRLRIILGNLISNGIKYGVKCKLEISYSESFCYFRVTDQGPGISKFESKKIFDQFFRSTDVENSSTGGLGLGLYIANKLALESSATLQLENPGESGAVFSLRIIAT